jgi:UDP-N-acetylglucosamine 2-epimerase (non-hydrolysing)
VDRSQQGPRSGRPEIWLVAGTRPEAVKLAPVADAIDRAGRMRASIVATGQHPTLVDHALATFGRAPDARCRVRRVSGGQAELLAQLVTGLERLAERGQPDAVIVQGDTTTTLAGALFAFWRRIPVVHLEAGLRSFDLGAPFPEELNRKLVTQTAALHLAPTPLAARHLRAEGVPEDAVLVAGNTVVDAIATVTDRPTTFDDPMLATAVEAATHGRRRLMLVTAHRRESWGAPLRRVLSAVEELLLRHDDLQVVFPVHPNPVVRQAVTDRLGLHPRALITEPLAYEQLAGVLAASTIVLSDSGGIQEEAPTFGVPVLVLRDTTERMEAVHAGCAVLVGTDEARIVAEASRLLSDASARTAMASVGNPFGDGHAAERTEQAVAWLLGLTAERPLPYEPAGARVSHA